MARPGQLASAIAEVLDLDSATVRQRARLLRNAGYMSMEKGGRGEGSMTPRDGINLLLAAAGSSRVKDSVRPVEQHGACRSMEGAWELPFSGLPQLLALDERHTFSDALEALVCAALNGSINPWTGDLSLPAFLGGPGPLAIIVTIREPLVMAEITVGLWGHNDDNATDVVDSVQRRYQTQPDAHGTFSPPFDAPSLSDLSHVHSFTEKAILRIARELLGS